MSPFLSNQLPSVFSLLLLFAVFESMNKDSMHSKDLAVTTVNIEEMECLQTAAACLKIQQNIGLLAIRKVSAPAITYDSPYWVT